jgi:uncharacterized protein (DUF697 family)
VLGKHVIKIPLNSAAFENKILGTQFEVSGRSDVNKLITHLKCTDNKKMVKMIKDDVEQFNIFKGDPMKRMYIFDSEGIKPGINLSEMLQDMENAIISTIGKIDIVVFIHNASTKRDNLLENETIQKLKKKYMFQVLFSHVEEFHYDQIELLKKETEEKFDLKNPILLTSDQDFEQIPSKGIIICPKCMSIDVRLTLNKDGNYVCKDQKCTAFMKTFIPCQCEDSSTCKITSKDTSTEVTVSCEGCNWKFFPKKFDISSENIKQAFYDLYERKIDHLNEEKEKLIKEIANESNTNEKNELIKKINQISNEITETSNGYVMFSISSDTKKSIFKILLSSAVVVAASVAAAGVGAAPIPFADTLLLIPIQTSLVMTLSAIWNVDPKVFPFKLISGFIGLCVAELIGFSIAGAAKASLVAEAPVLVIDAVVAGIVTLSLGTVISVLFGATWKICGDRPLTTNDLLNVLNFIPIKSIFKNVTNLRNQSNRVTLLDLTQDTIQIVVDKIENEKELENIKLIKQ